MKKYMKLGLVIGICLTVVSANLSLRSPGKLVIDTDAGGDDAGAILLALKSDAAITGFEVVAITCTYGNTYVGNVETNVLKILTVAGRDDIPVYVGASKPLIENYTSTNYFGKDGMGDFDFDEPIIGQVDRSKHASIALMDLAREHAGNISIMTLGPPTNVALAITLDPNFVSNVKRFYVMGGSVHGLGNVNPNVEANFREDPESNFILLNSTCSPTAVLFPWETAVSAAIPMKWRTDTLGATDSRTMSFLNKAEGLTLKNSHFWRPADIMITALVLRPELITVRTVTNVTPVSDGAARSTVLVDYDNLTGKPNNTEILEAFDVKGFQRLLLETLA